MSNRHRRELLCTTKNAREDGILSEMERHEGLSNRDLQAMRREEKNLPVSSNKNGERKGRLKGDKARTKRRIHPRNDLFRMDEGDEDA